ncbi:hypothetical protein fugu_001634 [Takifugu bimaculatus]|uniref:Arrestin C-terminal-like domain-containing protein n=1 Tax=Takifugu bimaculatus TaxID=433685 RepID=A0A4Z2BP37_9TELE|nr:hypothetical protein fugu_001634 [Takifugu bimaculatus]
MHRPRCPQRHVKELSFKILHACLQVVTRLLILLQPDWLALNVPAQVTLALKALLHKERKQLHPGALQQHQDTSQLHSRLEIYSKVLQRTDEMEDKPGTRVFKKTSPNSKLTVYLGKRDFVDHLTCVEPVDGVVLVEPDYLKDRKVFVTLNCAFRYGREDIDVLGLSFRKDLFVSTVQVFPPVEKVQKDLSQLQERLLTKLGQNAHPFTFTIPKNLPCSVTLQPGPEDSGKGCGVDYELQAFCAKTADEKLHQRNSVHLVIRKVQYAPETPGPQPMVETRRNYLMSDRSLHLEASLDKELYYHGEPISVNVHVSNSSVKTVKKVKISVRQYADICLFSTAQYKCQVAHLEAEDQVSPSSTSCHVYTLTPLLGNNREKRGLALDGKLKHEDTNLASSTIIKEGANKEMMGIFVSYRVKVKLVVSLGGDVAVELPFVLMHPKPAHQPSAQQQPAAVSSFRGYKPHRVKHKHFL